MIALGAGCVGGEGDTEREGMSNVIESASVTVMASFVDFLTILKTFVFITLANVCLFPVV